MIQKNKRINIQRVLVVERDKKEEPKKGLELSETVLLASIPILAYGLLYSYESHYLDYFGIPNQYINFELSEVFFVSALLFSFVIPVYQFFYILYDVTSFRIKKIGAKIKLLFLETILLFLIVDAYIHYRGENRNGAYAILTLVVLIFVLFFIWPLWYKKAANKSYIEKLEISLEDLGLNFWGLKVFYDKTSDVSNFELSIQINPKLAFLILSYIMGILLIGDYGTLRAIEQEKFGVLVKTPECAVVYNKTEYLFCTEFDRQNHQFQSGYQIYQHGDIKDIKILNEDIGPLHLKPTPTLTPLPTLTPTITPSPTLTPTSIPATVSPADT